jgi:hypothetical protein
VNRDVKQQFTLFKNAKKTINKWIEKYDEIYATMEKINPVNIKWTERMGFKKYKEDSRTIGFIYRKV